MANLDSILNSRDVILPTKVNLVKVMVFLVVMYGYESWTINKAEHRIIEDSWETYMQVRKQQLELDMEKQTGSK